MAGALGIGGALSISSCASHQSAPDGGLQLPTGDGGRGLTVEGMDWPDGRTFGWKNKDYVVGVTDFRDFSGKPIYDGEFASYTKIFGATATKYNRGNLDAFWASVHHHGSEEVGIFIGDANTHNGGNAWGFDVRAFSDTHDATLIGGFIGVKPGSQRTATTNGVLGSSRGRTALAASASAGASTIECVDDPGTGRFRIGANPEQEFVSVASVAGSGPYTVTLSSPLAYAQSAGSPFEPYRTQVIGLHIINEASNPGDIALWINTKAGMADGDWAEIIRCSNAAGTRVFGVSPAGTLTTGSVQPYDNGNRDLGSASTRFRALYVNGVGINGADMAGSSGAIGLRNAQSPPAAIPASGTVLYSEGAGLMATGGIGAWTNTDGAAVIRMQTEQPWAFKQVSAGRKAALRLSPDASDVVFSITNSDGTKAVIETTVSDTYGSQALRLLPHGGKLGLFGAIAVSQKARIGQIVDNSSGSVDKEMIEPVLDIQSAANAIATLTAKINALESILSAAGGGYGFTT